MSFQSPVMLIAAFVLTTVAVTFYVKLWRNRRAATPSALLPASTWRRHVPYVFLLAAIPLLLVGLARPEATVSIPRAAGTVILVFDVSNSMAADDLKPNRLVAAQAAAEAFVKAQPATVDIGVVMFSQAALTTLEPSKDHNQALNAVKRLKTNGGTSLGQAILAAMTAISGKTVTLEPEDIGYWRSATIVLFSDGEDTGGPDAEEAALRAADAGVRIQTVGIGTAQGATVEVDGYQVATALNEELLALIADTTGGSYHQASDTEALAEVTRSIDLRLTARPEEMELTAFFAGAALLLLTIGGLLMIRSHGRIV
ncbi:VWA domain-containing protein [Catelliglobosispora koreensis]|uniref:VWA domain-containing protein n=1 Tax=Catelliglobosispora koreensis TaxID=129052 RepID=UPI0003699411|nr:VWA domain-containing protein [Catelliglobosispora koreensis]